MKSLNKIELLNKLKDKYNDNWPPEIAEGFQKAVDIVEDTPTVDAVEVVRCKDCKWWKTNYMWNGNECKVCVVEVYEPIRNEDNYCSRGERK